MADKLEDLIRHSGDDAPPQQLDMAATVRRGTSLRRRRAAFRGVATFAALTVVGGLGFLGVQALQPPAGMEVAGPPPQAPASTPANPPTTAPSAPETSEGPTAAGFEKFANAAALEMLQPYGEVALKHSTDGDRGNDGGDPAHWMYSGIFSLVKDDVSTLVYVYATRGAGPDVPADDPSHHPTSCADVADADSCEDRADGSVLVTRTHSGWNAGDSRNTGEYSWEAALYRTDNIVIQFAASNGTGEKGEPLRDTPPITQQQLAELVTSPVWVDAPIPE